MQQQTTQTAKQSESNSKKAPTDPHDLIGEAAPPSVFYPKPEHEDTNASMTG